MFIQHSQHIRGMFFFVDCGSFGDICLSVRGVDTFPFLWACSVCLGQSLWSDSWVPSAAVGSNAELLGVWIPSITPTQQSAYHNRTVIGINRVSLDSSYCVIKWFLFGRSWTFCKVHVTLSSWNTKPGCRIWKISWKRGSSLSDIELDIWCGIFKAFMLWVVPEGFFLLLQTPLRITGSSTPDLSCPYNGNWLRSHYLTWPSRHVHFLHRLRGRKNGGKTNQSRWFWSSAAAGICCVFLWLIESVSLHGKHPDMTILGRFPFVLKYIWGYAISELFPSWCPATEGCPVCVPLFTHDSLILRPQWSFFYCHLFLGSSLRPCLLVCFCILKPM